jgi:hypothetical protein
LLWNIYCCGLLYDAVNIKTIVSNGEVSGELESIWDEAVMAQSTYYPGICLEGMRK